MACWSCNGRARTGPDQLDVAIIDGRWLRISAVQPELGPRPQTISYWISNGTNSGVQGEVVVTQRPEPADNTPITVADKVVVRAGAAVSAPVLDNDVSPAGDRLSLVGDLVGSETPGQLEVVAPVDVTGDVGKAFVSGRVVRYVAPDKIEERDTFDVPYVAQNLDGKRATGHLRVTVVPTDDPNDPPEPPTLEGRVVSADSVKVRMPGRRRGPQRRPGHGHRHHLRPATGPDRSIGGNFLEYQAYPRTVGTDEFTYSVVDPREPSPPAPCGSPSSPPGQPQPPLAVADRLTVEPGRTATFDPLANDSWLPVTRSRSRCSTLPTGATLDPRADLVAVPAPDAPGAAPMVIVYAITNGLDSHGGP